MLLGVGKNVVVRRLCRTFAKDLILRKNFALSTRILVVSEQKLGLSKIWDVTKGVNLVHVPKCFTSDGSEGSLDKLTFESICSETLDSLTEYFEELIESIPHLKNADVTYSDGVLTVHLGKTYGTYVINRQTPNLQIWLSSPTSGPKRYDFVDGTWVYKHDKTTLHSLLDREIKEIANQQVQFVEKCLYAKANL